MANDKKVMDIEILGRSGIEELDAEEKISKVVVIGAGTMGQGISQLIASKGIDVDLVYIGFKQHLLKSCICPTRQVQ